MLLERNATKAVPEKFWSEVERMRKHQNNKEYWAWKHKHDELLSNLDVGGCRKVMIPGLGITRGEAIVLADHWAKDLFEARYFLAFQYGSSEIRWLNDFSARLDYFAQFLGEDVVTQIWASHKERLEKDLKDIKEARMQGCGSPFSEHDPIPVAALEEAESKVVEAALRFVADNNLDQFKTAVSQLIQTRAAMEEIGKKNAVLEWTEADCQEAQQEAVENEVPP